MKKNTIIFKLVAAIIAISIIGFISINLLFKWNSNNFIIEAEWDAADALNYFGTILAAIIGIIGVYYSIMAAQNNYRDDLINQSLPFFALNILYKKRKHPNNWLEYSYSDNDEKKEKSNDDWQYSEIKLRTIYFVFDNDSFVPKYELSTEQIDLIKKDGNTIHNGDFGETIFSKTLILSQPYELENVGKGPAINTRIGFNKSSVTKNERKYIKPENLKVGDFFYINIYIQNITDSVIGEYVLEVNYSDIYGNNYSQENKISIEKKFDKSSSYILSTEFVSNQKSIKKD